MIIAHFDSQINNALKEIHSVDVFQNGYKVSFIKGSKKFSTIESKIVDILRTGRILPALAVSIHEYTISEMQSGVWIQINLKREIVLDGLPFDALLFKAEKTGGINLIRRHNGKYEGRCIYLDLDREIFDNF